MQIKKIIKRTINISIIPATTSNAKKVIYLLSKKKDAAWKVECAPMVMQVITTLFFVTISVFDFGNPRAAISEAKVCKNMMLRNRVNISRVHWYWLKFETTRVAYNDCTNLA